MSGRWCPALFRTRAVFVDDNSPDGTVKFARIAQTVRRIGRRGLERAVVVRSSSRSSTAICNDETRLPEMLAGFAGKFDPSAAGSWMAAMMPVLPIDGVVLSNGGIRLAQLFLPCGSA